MSEVSIYIGGLLNNWTSMTLSRSKDAMTGELSVTVFMSYIPGAPVLTQVAAGRPVQVYIGNELSFNGVIDSRTGNADATSYNLTISARGKTKRLIDNSNDKKQMMLKPTNREVFDELVKDTEIEIEWLAQTHKLEKVRFRNSARLHEEIQRVATENAHFTYETREGKLRITDDTSRKSGVALILGQEFLSFSAEQSEHEAKSEIIVKGKRTDKNVRGKNAVEKTIQKQKDNSVRSKSQLTVHHYGDGTDEALKRRAKFEADKRNSTTKNVKIDVFHVQPITGEAWEIGLLHMVSIPPEGINDQFECVGIEYAVDNEKTIKTSLTLSPPPKAASTSSGSAVAALQKSSSKKNTKSTDNYPAPWVGSDLIDSTDIIEEKINSINPPSSISTSNNRMA